MTTIVTVHGTFANHDDEHGELWWQKSSPFHKEIIKRLHADPHDLEWIPFHWSGKNSEMDRRKGGEELFEFLVENLETNGRPYSLVGHSHGGSVIAEALRVSALKNRELKNLRSWITVATPFLKFKKKRNLFRRLKRRYQFMLLFAFAYALAVIIAAPLEVCSDDYVFAPGECLVSKNDLVFIKPEKITTITPEFTKFEKSSLDRLLLPDFSDNASLSTETSQYKIWPFVFKSENSGREILELTVPAQSVTALAALDNGAVIDEQAPLTDPAKSQFINFARRKYFDLDLCEPTNWHFFGQEGVPKSHRAICGQLANIDASDNESALKLNQDLWRLDHNTNLPDDAFERALTFFVGYDDGTSQRVRLFFNSITDVYVQTFIPAKDVWFSRALAIYLALMLIPIYIVGAIIWKSQDYRRQRYVPVNRARFKNWYQHRWFKLSHPEDEAVNAINGSTKVKKDVAPKNILKWELALTVSVVVFIYLIFWSSFSENTSSILDLIDDKMKGGDIYADGTRYKSSSNIYRVLANYDIPLLLALLLAIAAAVPVIAMLIRYAEKKFANPAAKSLIDGIVSNSVIKGAFGNDALGEAPAECKPHPPEFADPHTGNFPEQVRLAVETHANSDLSQLAQKLREALHKGAMGKSGFSVNDLLEGDMGEVLLHTSYFSVTEFHDLFAATLVHTGDFHPKPAFDNHKKASIWVENIKSGPKKEGNKA